MASSSAQPYAFSLLGSMIGCPVTERLTKKNFPLWKMQVLSAIRGAQLEHYLEPTTVPPPKQTPKTEKSEEMVPNLDYPPW